MCDPEQAESFDLAQKLRNEFVIHVSGNVRERPEGTINAELPSGEVEVAADTLTILNKAAALPFNVDDYQEVSEEVRLRYRYLDLRRTEMSERIKTRAKITQYIRRYFDEKEFLDIETPILTKSTPEGARDYLVPSRTQPRHFFALPQSPQIFKQLLMISGFNRYYQIVRCFRDEDLRADRQPEFTQLDVEMAFTDEATVQSLTEDMLRGLFKTVLDVKLPNPFPHITYQDAMTRYGSDRPDLRNPLELIEIADLLKDVEFKVFSGPANDAKCRVAALLVPKGADISRKAIDDYTAFVAIYGAKGLAYIKVNDASKGKDGLQSPILKFLPDDAIAEILKRTKAKTGDLIFFGADKAKVVNEALGALRNKLGKDLNLLKEPWSPVWVVDFPLFEEDEKGGWMAPHHPFTAPQEKNPKKISANPGQTLSRAYDVVLNGNELGGGSIRIDDIDMQYAVFDILGIDKDSAKRQFQHLLTALTMGVHHTVVLHSE